MNSASIRLHIATVLDEILVESAVHRLMATDRFVEEETNRLEDQLASIPENDTNRFESESSVLRDYAEDLKSRMKEKHPSELKPNDED